MKAIIFGALLGAFLLWPPALPLTAATVSALAGQPAVLVFVLGVLARPAIARRVRGGDAMSDPLAKAEAAAVEAADNTDLTRQIAAILAAQQLLNQQKAPACQHQAAPASQFDAKKWLVIGGVVVSVGLVGALFAVAIAIGACCATGCLLILRGMWRDFQKGK
ncbi:hypothetical protein OG985_21655 [Streptomyces sp. NBC_00289]|uniref:hypothetical protein n=1 Tax=Streptomyces sp. NBC_00289 TaxID=2975703 RepID=UPI00324BCFE1